MIAEMDYSFARQKIMRSWNIKVIFFLVLSLSIMPSARAQQRDARGSSGQSRPAPTTVADEREGFKKGVIKTSEEYRATLQDLATSSEKNWKQLCDQNIKLKELYKEGLVSRRDLEESDHSVTEALAKVEGVRRQITQAGVWPEAAIKEPSQGEPASANETKAGITGVAHPWTTGNKSIDGLIRYNGQRYGVDPYLIYCVMHQESGFGPQTVSPKGALGLMQLMPGTAARYGVTNAYDPAQNIMAGTRYLRDLLQLFNGRIDLALAGYNAGEGAVMKYGNHIPPYRETQNYVRAIGTRYTGNTLLTPTMKTISPTRRKRTK